MGLSLISKAPKLLEANILHIPLYVRDLVGGCLPPCLPLPPVGVSQMLCLRPNSGWVPH